MWFWWFMLFCTLLTPALMMVAGRIMWKHPPQKINHFIGYRTSRSMQNMDTWTFAHEHAGQNWWKTGWILLVPSVLIHALVCGTSESTIGITGIVLLMIQMVVLFTSIFSTEKALKNTFNEDGTRK